MQYGDAHLRQIRCQQQIYNDNNIICTVSRNGLIFLFYELRPGSCGLWIMWVGAQCSGPYT